MRRRKHTKDGGRKRSCPYCGSLVRRTSPQTWSCAGCPVHWPMDRSNPGAPWRHVTSDFYRRAEPMPEAFGAPVTPWGGTSPNA